MRVSFLRFAWQATAAFLAADTDEDGEVTLDDAFRILSYYSLSAAGREADWETI